mmetsp:Transcript_745/g.1366  ORF Transcript_745/g.1366 Transcript_745/m.1366 type:complete len:284 (-) Transcript_745:57-908(-)|eukprot:CAMPEP_0178793182 /NCGR_PEP_ID=MMETSP0745-20121128/8931_1 /TAXON_ID=913974 /ORGANISM="Nitzschia punctata, Strain CCMP561" /LENGTH=283 /DNA_ID=CAMNT_0020451441 /DNA_START=168 /DNA_END=1019 /DNA_ORIENTATION=-
MIITEVYGLHTRTVSSRLSPTCPQSSHEEHSIDHTTNSVCRSNQNNITNKKRSLSAQHSGHCVPKALPAKKGAHGFHKSHGRVHFQKDPATGRLVRKSIYGRATLTAQEKKALWWDMQSLRRSVKRTIRLYKANDEQPQQGGSPSSSSSSSSHLSCCTSNAEFAQRYRQTRELCNANAINDGMGQQGELPIHRLLSEAPMRGLEQRLFPENIVERQEIIRKVLAAQDKLPTQLSPEQQAKLLRAASQNLTRGSRLLARLYGMGDAAAAAACLETTNTVVVRET